MRYGFRFGFAFVLGLALMAAFPTEVSTQEEQKKSWLERTYPEAFVDPSKPEVAKEALDEPERDAAVSAPTPEDEASARVQRARSGLIVSAVVLAGGGAIITGSMIATRNYSCPEDEWFCLNGGRIAGATIGSLLMLGGLIGMGVSGGKLSSRKQELRNLQEANKPQSRRVQFDPHTSRFVF